MADSGGGRSERRRSAPPPTAKDPKSNADSPTTASLTHAPRAHRLQIGLKTFARHGIKRPVCLIVDGVDGPLEARRKRCVSASVSDAIGRARPAELRCTGTATEEGVEQAKGVAPALGEAHESKEA